MSLKTLALFAVISVTHAATAQPSQPAATSTTLRYRNPVWDGYLADPHVFRASDGVYYAIGTGLRDTAVKDHDKETPGYTGHFPMLRSRDFQTWELVGGALALTVEPVVSKVHWAPEVAERDGKFYLYYAGDYKLRVAVADHPAGPYTDTGKVLMPKNGFNIDGHPFRDPVSGKWYLFFAMKFTLGERKGTGLAVVRLGDDMLSVTGPIQPITTAFLDWQLFNPRQGDYCVEGPFVIYRAGRYWCFYSGGDWKTPGYGVGCAVADTITGSYTDPWSLERGSVVGTIGEELIGPGHNSVVIGPDSETYFLAYHSWNTGRTARQLCIDPLIWTDQGPKVYRPGRGEKTITLPLASH